MVSATKTMKNYQNNFVFILFTGLLLLKVAHSVEDMVEVMKKDGYVAETHNVTTEDGYIITIQRIKGDNNSTPILVFHGLPFNSAIWVMLGPRKSLPYLLADQGYDVWLGNARGTDYGVSHVNLTTDDFKFWDFSFHEMGTFDVPAIVEYISGIRRRRIVYIAHSQGTEIGFIMAIRRPETAKKVSLMVSMAPLAYLSNVRGFLRYFHPFFFFLEWLREFLPLKGFLLPNPVVRLIAKSVCNPTSLQSYLCQIVVFSVGGFDFEQFAPVSWDAVLRAFLAGSSVKNWIHHSQHIKSGKFNEYDYGESENLRVYNQSSPPDYDLTQINVPTAFFSAKADYLARHYHALEVYKLLPRKEGFHTIDYEKFTHYDFLWAKDIKKLVYDHVINLVNSHRDA